MIVLYDVRDSQLDIRAASDLSLWSALKRARLMNERSKQPGRYVPVKQRERMSS